MQSDEGSDPLSVEDFAGFTEGLELKKYEYVGGAGENKPGCLVDVIERLIKSTLSLQMLTLQMKFPCRQHRGDSSLSKPT